jgi:L-alanine-DL-glutamate epimerase-like enolase superfamily enzyme
VSTSALVPLTDVEVRTCTVPTQQPESDGTLEWDSTTLVLVEASAGGRTGLGFTFGHAAAAAVARETLAPVVRGRDAMATVGAWQAMLRAVRNTGRPGVASMAVAAVDTALWDLKARLLELPLVTLLGAVRETVPVYASGGFTSLSLAALREQLAGWVEAGIPRVKMKVGRDPAADPVRVRAARDAIGPDAELYVDANGAYARKQALDLAASFAEAGVTWFEEPVPSDDLEGLRLLRDRAPAGMEVAAGEYGSELADFRRLLEAGAVDVLQADVTRCQGITGLLRVGALCEAFGVPLSAHTAPALHAHAACALPALRHVEYFHDHVQLERLLFEGAPEPVNGVLRPDTSRPGLGLELRRADAERFAR